MGKIDFILEIFGIWGTVGGIYPISPFLVNWFAWNFDIFRSINILGGSKNLSKIEWETKKRAKNGIRRPQIEKCCLWFSSKKLILHTIGVFKSANYGHREKTVPKSDQNCGFWTRLSVLCDMQTVPSRYFWQHWRFFEDFRKFGVFWKFGSCWKCGNLWKFWRFLKICRILKFVIFWKFVEFWKFGVFGNLGIFENLAFLKNLAF